MTPSESEIIDAMTSFGGSFVSALGKAWRLADDRNRAALSAAFPEYWKQYRELAILRKQQVSER